MANGISPYQVAAPTVNLMGQAGVTKKKKQESDISTSLQMGKMEEQFFEDIDRFAAAAKKKEKKNRGLFGGLNILSLLLGPIGAGLLSGAAGFGRAKQSQKGRELLVDLMPDKWKNTFLRGGHRDYMTQAEGQQVSDKDIFKSTAIQGILGVLTSKAMGGKVGEGGLGKKLGGNLKDMFGDIRAKKLGYSIDPTWGETGPLKSIWKGLLGTAKDINPLQSLGFCQGRFDPKMLIMLPALLDLIAGKDE